MIPDTYRTTRPILPSLPERRPIEFLSSRGHVGELRVPEESDVAALHLLRTQHEVMVNTSQGRVDRDLEETHGWMRRFMPPNEQRTFNWCVWVKHEAHGWEHIGILGLHTLSPVPYLGYMIRTEWWGKGIVGTATRSLIRAYWALDRTVVEVPFPRDDDGEAHVLKSIDHTDDGQPASDRIPEMLFAKTTVRNEASNKILTSCGFKAVHRQTVLDDSGLEVELVTYGLRRPCQS